MATVQFRTESVRSHRMDQLIRMLNDSNVKKEVNQFIADAITPYVPMKSGALRRSVYVGPTLISWGRGLKYARYQYNGELFRPARPITRNGEVVDFFETKGIKKVPTGLPLHYSTPGTTHHWTDMYKWKVKSDTNKEITRYLKAECKRRGLST